MNPGILVHYGSDTFHSDNFYLPKNRRGRNKPSGGLWTSPKESKISWFNWCKINHYKENKLEKSFLCKLKEDSKILIIDSKSDLEKISTISYQFLELKFNYPDFEKISEDFDAIWVTERGLSENKKIWDSCNLNGWDCETVLILNSKVIELI